ncbi:substrate-binding domain-containing protein [Verminephrobacter eiseniae]|uniref:substrate-binding domain-containing protein n=1 Tax=Verminephrobacter eiseniae TaxID=364317 RepID=UPI0022381462|nr:substrate-binding domain-containing protein [Verminephrobacter eiseniae]MCW5232990.1 ABC transporter substrate-binding protein [Verminephrobacter eiseniae]MCW5295454.1 ABC transporter substrate-binding protein [Verminephrobacter eiseniae]MCW8187200.1 ABC transporter substrate-binding protein [Verminephrobacter eiseniae]MCW8224210.1 ABC transporter substrate-binding protein [Verminephrobacter eiseniae]MCW8233217.1 ABC transporter substrate-binding protein [Verminephrobacter eiseniae]
MTRLGLRCIASMATRQLLAELLPGFTQRSGHGASVESVAGVDAARRVQDGEVFDLVLLASDAIDKLMAAGRLLPGSKVDWVCSGMAVAVRAGAPLPDIHSEEALRQTVLAAGRIGHSTGPSGVALVRLFRRWGIADALHERMVQAPPGVPVGALIAAGAAELGFQQHSELLHVPGIQIVGPLPPALQINTTFSAAVGAQSLQVDAARALLAYLASPLAQDAKRRQGMEPA